MKSCLVILAKVTAVFLILLFVSVFALRFFYGINAWKRNIRSDDFLKFHASIKNYIEEEDYWALDDPTFIAIEDFTSDAARKSCKKFQILRVVVYPSKQAIDYEMHRDREGTAGVLYIDKKINPRPNWWIIMEDWGKGFYYYDYDQDGSPKWNREQGSAHQSTTAP